MVKEDMVHIYSEILAIKRNKIEMWMDIESVIESEVSQKVKTIIY